jgi:hypothetical protein
MGGMPRYVPGMQFPPYYMYPGLMAQHQMFRQQTLGLPSRTMGGIPQMAMNSKEKEKEFHPRIVKGEPKKKDKYTSSKEEEETPEKVDLEENERKKKDLESRLEKTEEAGRKKENTFKKMEGYDGLSDEVGYYNV